MITAIKTLSILVITSIHTIVCINQHIASNNFFSINKNDIFNQSKKIILSIENQQLVSLETYKIKITANFKNQNFTPCLIYIFLCIIGISILLYCEKKSAFKLKTDFSNSKINNRKKLKLNQPKLKNK